MTFLFLLILLLDWLLDYLLLLRVLRLLHNYLWLRDYLLYWLLDDNRLLYNLPWLHDHRLNGVDLYRRWVPRHVELLLHHLELRFIWSRSVHLKLPRHSSCWLTLASNYPILTVIGHLTRKVFYSPLKVLSCKE